MRYLVCDFFFGLRWRNKRWCHVQKQANTLLILLEAGAYVELFTVLSAIYCTGLVYSCISAENK